MGVGLTRLRLFQSYRAQDENMQLPGKSSLTQLLQSNSTSPWLNSLSCTVEVIGQLFLSVIRL